MTLPELSSSRLVLRELGVEDRDFVEELMKDPAQIANVGTIDANALAFIDRLRASAWQARTIADATAKVGITFLEVRAPVGNLGYAVVARASGKGYATEMARRVVKYAFEDLRLLRVIASCSAQNTASLRILRALGMRPHPNASPVVNPAGRSEDFYELSVERYRPEE